MSLRVAALLAAVTCVGALVAILALTADGGPVPQRREAIRLEGGDAVTAGPSMPALPSALRAPGAGAPPSSETSAAAASAPPAAAAAAQAPAPLPPVRLAGRSLDEVKASIRERERARAAAAGKLEEYEAREAAREKRREERRQEREARRAAAKERRERRAVELRERQARFGATAPVARPAAGAPDAG